MTTSYLACDLGAESGRLMLGTLTDGKLALEEIHRFSNIPIKANGSLHWDLPRLFDELKFGLKKAAARKIPISSISTDSWGVDYVLLDSHGSIIAPTFHYRDLRTARGIENVLAKVSREKIFAETGVQFIPINALFQLGAESPERLRNAVALLGVADAFNHWLSGVARTEQSIASTFQLYNPQTKDWSEPLLEAVQLSRRILPPMVPSGTCLGLLRPDLARETGLANVEVIATCSHDTGAAVAAVPADNKSTWAYISSGTWSLVGIEWPVPIINGACQELNFTNELGYGGSVRLLKNIVGLWIVQECRRDWAKHGQDLDYGTLTRWAAEAPPFVSLINPSDPRFSSPDEMPAKIAGFCHETKQPVPTDPGATIRCVLESLALLYRRTLRQAERLTEKKIERLHIVGGGSKNSLLNQFTANAAQVPVLAGPVEATALGNICVQAIALKHMPSLGTARRVVSESFGVERIESRDAAEWNESYERFEQLVSS